MLIKTENIQEVAKAMIAFESEVKGFAKDAQGHNYKYITLDQILYFIRPILAKHKLVMMQNATGSIENGESISEVETIIMHESGQYISTGVMKMRLCGAKPGAPTTPRDFGSAVSYSKRYQLTALLGLSADVDDDAAAVSESARTWGAKVDENTLHALGSIMKTKGIDKARVEQIMLDDLNFIAPKASKNLTQFEAENLIEFMRRIPDLIKEAV